MYTNNKSLDRIEGEIFRPISGYEDLYSVSNMGRIRSETKTFWTGKYFRTIQERIMSINIDNQNNQCRITLSQGGDKEGFMVSHLVALEFIGSWDKDTHIIMHKNKDPMDNRVENLEITTWEESVFMDFYLRKKLPLGFIYDKKLVTRKHGIITYIKCTVCKQKKPVSEYYKSSIVDNEVRMYICADCCNEKWGISKDIGKYKRYKKLISKGYKICPNCVKKKKLSQFNKNKNRQGGVGTYCKKCSIKLGRKFFDYQDFYNKIAKRNKKIVKLYNTGKYSQKAIGKIYNITQSAVYYILKNNKELL